MPTPAQHQYDESKIKTLSSVEHIRQRTGMYIGRKGDGGQYEDGIYILLKEVIDNAVDEFIMGHGKKVDIAVDYASGEASVRDYGRGIPLGKIVECVSQINTGAKYNDEVFQFSVGLNGVGTKAVTPFRPASWCAPSATVSLPRRSLRAASSRRRSAARRRTNATARWCSSRPTRPSFSSTVSRKSMSSAGCACTPT